MTASSMLRNNRFYYFYRFFKWKIGDRSPLVAAIKITQKCNLRCTHCPWKNRILSDLSTEKWKLIIKDLWDKGCTVLTFEGGEPTIRNDLKELLDYSSDLGFKTIVVTNGTQEITDINPDRLW